MLNRFQKSKRSQSVGLSQRLRAPIRRLATVADVPMLLERRPLEAGLQLPDGSDPPDACAAVPVEPIFDEIFVALPDI